jgi:CheY-like chemotaxis protein
VEDNEFNQLLAISILEQWGISWDQAYNGSEAIAKLSSSSYDLVLMDIQMPIMGGLEATNILRNDLKIPIPIIALTANAMKEDIEAYLQAGFDSCVTKPFEQTVLLETICRYLSPLRKAM